MGYCSFVFMGTPAFAVTALDVLWQSRHRCLGVVSRPPAAGGRGRVARPSPVAAFAGERGLALWTPPRLDDAFVAVLKGLRPDIIVTAAYGLLLPATLLNLPPHGCVNLHPSLLPRWRGADPLRHALLAGDRATGVSLMLMDEGWDTGAIFMRESVTIAPDWHYGALHDVLAARGGAMAVRLLDALAAATGSAPVPSPQSRYGAKGARRAPKLPRSAARLDWRNPAEELARQVRAFAPAPGAWFLNAPRGGRVKVLAARAVSGLYRAAGVVLAHDEGGLIVSCGSGGLCLLELQREGGRRMAVAEFLRGNPLPPATRLPAAGDDS